MKSPVEIKESFGALRMDIRYSCYTDGTEIEEEPGRTVRLG